MDTTDFERYAFLEEAIRYVKQHLNNIVLLLVVKMKSSNDYKNQYDVETEFFSEEELSDYIEALDSLGIYHDISYGEDDFIHKINTNYFEKYKYQHKIVFNTTGSKRIRSRSALIPAVCEMVGLRYASSDILTCSLLENKIHANALLEHYGFPVPPSCIITQIMAGRETDLRKIENLSSNRVQKVLVSALHNIQSVFTLMILRI